MLPMQDLTSFVDRVQPGFGCASLNSLYRRRSLNAVAAAYDAGVRYFDVARMYGDGTAEDVLGRALAGRRSNVYLASKVGILPPDRTFLQQWDDKLRLFARRARIPSGWLGAPRAAAAPRFHRFGADEVESSVHQSLIALGTDYLDVLLLHEVSYEASLSDELRRVLSRLVESGKVRALGTATGFSETLKIISEAPVGPVIQVPASPLDDRINQLERPTGSLLVVHSCLGHHWRQLVQRLPSNTTAKDALAPAFGDSATGPDLLGERVLAYMASRIETGGVVLFSSLEPRRIAGNTRAILDYQQEPAVDVVRILTLLQG